MRDLSGEFLGYSGSRDGRRSFDLVYCCLVHCNHLFNSPVLLLKTITSLDNGFLKFMYFLWGVNSSLKVGTGQPETWLLGGLRLSGLGPPLRLRITRDQTPPDPALGPRDECVSTWGNRVVGVQPLPSTPSSQTDTPPAQSLKLQTHPT